MKLFGASVLTTAYFPPVEYFFAIARSGKVLIEQHEKYQKQSYRNRCRILSAAGPEDLSIPIVKDGTLSRPIRDLKIDYSDNWLQRHLRAFSAAYNSSAFFEYYEDELSSILLAKPVFLFDLNCSLLERLLELTGIRADISFTESYLSDYEDAFDFRERIHPKHKGESLLQEYKKEKTYFQVFSDKYPFTANLSILDLLSAEGPNALSFLL